MNLRQFLELAQAQFHAHRFTRQGMVRQPGQIFDINCALIEAAAAMLRAKRSEELYDMLTTHCPVPNQSSSWGSFNIHDVTETLAYLASIQFRQFLVSTFPTEMADWEHLEEQRIAGLEDLDIQYVLYLVTLKFTASNNPDEPSVHGLMEAIRGIAITLHQTRYEQLASWLLQESPAFANTSHLAISQDEVTDWFVTELFGRFWQYYREDIIQMLDVEALYRGIRAGAPVSD